MALDFLDNPDYARQEIDAAIIYRRKWTDMSRELKRRAAGPSFRTDWGEGQDYGENFDMEFITNFVPNLVENNPRVEVESDLLDPDSEQVRAMVSGLNGWVQKKKLARILRVIANDVCYDFGCAMVALEDLPGYDADSEDDADRWDRFGLQAPERPMMPTVHRLSPTRVFRDAHGAPGSTRFDGHMWIRDKDDLLKAKNPDGSPKFDREAVELLTEGVGVHEVYEEMGFGSQEHSPHRKQVVGYEWYCPETGLIYTLGYTATGGNDGKHAFLREPRRYFGPRRGPYVYFGCAIIPDQLYPISPLAITNQLVTEIDAHSAQVRADAAAAKQLIIVDGNNKQAVEGITSSPNGTVLSVPGFTGAHAVVQLGGAQKANLDHIDRLVMRWERQTGINDTIRGNITGATARETDLAANKADIRTRFAASQFNESTVDVLEAAAFLMHESHLVRFPVRVRDPMTGRLTTYLFIGGPHPGMEFARFDDLQFKITPYSMEHVDENLRQVRAQNATKILLEVVPASIQYPCLKPRELIDDLFESHGIRDAGSRYVDFDILDAMRGMAQTQQAAQTLADTSGAMAQGVPPAGQIGPQGAGSTAGPAGGAVEDPMQAYAAELAAMAA